MVDRVGEVGAVCQLGRAERARGLNKPVCPAVWSYRYDAMTAKSEGCQSGDGNRGRTY